MEGLRALIKGTLESSLAPPAMGGHIERRLFMNQATGPHQTLNMLML